MSRYVACRACACYVARHEAMCPFCGVSRTHSLRWALGGAFVLNACVTGTTPTLESDASGDASIADTNKSGPDTAPPCPVSDPHLFTCGGVTCHCNVPALGGTGGPCPLKCDQPTCVDCLNCSCQFGGTVLTCSQSDAGPVFGCAACYGAPPTRGRFIVLRSIDATAARVG